MLGDWVSSFPSSWNCGHPYCIPLQTVLSSVSTRTLGGKAISWGRRNCSLCSPMGQAGKKNNHSWGSCLLFSTKRVLTSLWLCGYMLYDKVYCTSGALCRTCALPRCWPLFANGALLGMGASSHHVSPHSALPDTAFIPFPCSWATQQFITSPWHRAGHKPGTSTSMTWVKSRAKK